MKTIAHISDLHFGRTDPAVVTALAADIIAARPDLVVVSGDLTQRARPGQFRAAKAFLESLPVRCLVVPGNHDIPAFNLLARLSSPFRHYRRYIGTDLNPFLDLGDVAVLGLNTARSVIVDFAHGRVNREQMQRIRACLGGRDGVFKIVVTHHPFLPPPDRPDQKLVGRSVKALAALEQAGVDLLLAGHLHRAYSGDAMGHHGQLTRSILVAQASTATSTRLRNEPNAWNLLEAAPGRLCLKVRTWEGARFMPAQTLYWEKHGPKWERVIQDSGLATLDAIVAERRRVP